MKRLDEYNTIRNQNSEYLTKGLSGIKGIQTPIVPGDRTHAYFMYRLRFDPEILGIDIPRRKFREAIEKALFMEGVPVGQSDKIPLYKHPLFQKKTGYGKNCPWSCSFYSNDPQPLNDDLFVHVNELFEDHTLIRGIHPPNDISLMDLYIEAVEKVFQNLDEVIEKGTNLELPVYNCELMSGYF